MTNYASMLSLRVKQIKYVFLCFMLLVGFPNIACSEETPAQEIRVSDYIKLGLKYEANGDLERAFDEFKKAIKKDKKDYRGYFGIANIQHKTRDELRAEDNFRRAIELAPDNAKPMIHNNLAWLYIETNRALMAVMLIREIEGTDMERNYIYQDTLATAYVYMDNYFLAKVHYNEALLYMPLDNLNIQLSIFSHIREMYLKIGNNDMVFKLDEILKKLELGHPATLNDLGVGGLK